jgi:hypothetical protein
MTQLYPTMKNYTGIALGIILGCAGLLGAQWLIKSPAAEEPAPPAEVNQSLSARRQGQQLADARKRIKQLEAEVAATTGVEAAPATQNNGADLGAEKDGDAKKSASFIEMMMSLGDEKAKRKIEEEVARLTEILGLSEDQQAVVRDSLARKAADQKSAGVLIMTGKASVDDLIMSDEHNFTRADAEIVTVLDEEQLGEFETEQAAREQMRIETKTEEELGELAKRTELSEEQTEAAWEALAEINAAEKPGGIPEGTTGEEFMGYIDGAITNRIEALSPILAEEQMGAYEGQTQEFRKMITTLLVHAIETPAE